LNFKKNHVRVDSSDPVDLMGSKEKNKKKKQWNKNGKNKIPGQGQPR
jgi:hypothetical protein